LTSDISYLAANGFGDQQQI